MTIARTYLFRIAVLISATSFSYNQATAQWTDDFESYSVGDINGQSLWVDFGGTLTSDVSTDQARSGSNSLKLTLNPVDPNPIDLPGYGSDVYLDFAEPISSGVWELSYWMYLPSEFNGVAYSFFSEGAVGEGDFNFGMQLLADADPRSDIFSYFDGENAPITDLVKDQWVEVSAKIDFDTNQLELSYNGALFVSGPWDPDSGADATAGTSLAGMDLWVEAGTVGSVYYDDFSLTQVPEPSSTSLFLLGLSGMLLRSRRRS